MHKGLVNNNLTLTPIGRLLNNVFGKTIDEMAKLEKLSDPAEAKIIIDQMVKDKKISVEEANSMYKTFEEMSALSTQSGLFSHITFGEMSKTFKELVEPLIVDNKGNGVLTLSTVQSASMSRGEMRLLLDSLMMMKDSTFVSDTTSFVNALRDSILLNPKGTS